jgi:hypothetical protein
VERCGIEVSQLSVWQIVKAQVPGTAGAAFCVTWKQALIYSLYN